MITELIITLEINFAHYSIIILALGRMAKILVNVNIYV